MKTNQIPACILVIVATAVVGTAQQGSPFLGRWDFNISLPNGGHAASWLGVYDEHGSVEVWYQPIAGNVMHIQDFKIDSSHLTFSFMGHTATATWELSAATAN